MPCSSSCERSRCWNCFSQVVPGNCGVGVATRWRCADADGNRNVFRNLSPLQKVLFQARDTNFATRGINIHFPSLSLVLSDVFQSSTLFVG